MQRLNKRIVICCDGTWNKPDSKPTNVVKMARGIMPYVNRHHQVVFYDQGVGTQGLFDKYIGGAFGLGVSKNILDAYRFIVHNYHPGDEIFCFGFSRGAYTVRALGGLLHTIGLIPKNELDTLSQAYSFYRTHPKKRDHDVYTNNLRPNIAMIGVWDTVGALGSPTPLFRKITNRWIGFFDTTLSEHVKHAYQALALDEKRHLFTPDLWTGSVNADQTVDQRWFPGVHSNIGGGYPDSGLSDITLTWMIDKARLLGLSFEPSFIKELNPNPDGKLYDSFSTGFALLDKFNNTSGIRNINGDKELPPINVTIDGSIRLKENYDPVNYLDQHKADHRLRPRVFTPGLVAVINEGGGEGQCEIVNASESGLQLIYNGTISEHTVISTDIFDKRPVTVAWHHGKRYGLQFAA